jgi:hypothetical protein
MPRSFRAPPELADLFARSPSETTPILLELSRAQAARRGPAELLRQMSRDLFVAPSVLDQRTVHVIDGIALDAAREFEAIQLSPLAPLGACSSVALTSQDRTLSTNRAAEVVSDPTNVLALLAALRLARDPKTNARSCTLHQVLRAQPFPPVPGFSRHFRLFVASEAGPARAEDGFEVEAIALQLTVFDRIFDAWAARGGRVSGKRILVRCTPPRALLARRALDRLATVLPHVPLEQAGEGPAPYYDGVRVTFSIDGPGGEPLPIGDLGVFDWMSKLTSNRRMRYVASGLGIQLLPLLLGPPTGVPK